MQFLFFPRSAVRRPLPALALALALISAALSAEETPAATVVGLRTAGPDLEVFLAGPPGMPASAVLIDSHGSAVASGPVEMKDGEARAVLTGALARIATHGPAWRVMVMGDDGSVLGSELPFLVVLRCPPGGPCRFQLLSGLAAQGTALVDPALGRALDDLPAGTADQLAAAVAIDPSLRGAALTAAWHWAALPVAPNGLCGCVWALEASLPGGTGEGGLAVGVTGREVSGEDGVRLDQARAASLALRQRCARTEVRSAETVAVAAADGSWSTVLQIPRVVLSGCPAPCTPAVAWEAEVEGQSVARVEGGLDASAKVFWEAEVEVDGAEVLQVEDGASAVSGQAGDEALRRAQGAGGGELVALRATARAEMAAPGEPAGVEAIAAVAWHLAGRGVSLCAQPGQVGVSATSRLLQPIKGDDVVAGPCDPGQIGLLISNGRVCKPGWRK